MKEIKNNVILKGLTEPLTHMYSKKKQKKKNLQYIIIKYEKTWFPLGVAG